MKERLNLWDDTRIISFCILILISFYLLLMGLISSEVLRLGDEGLLQYIGAKRCEVNVRWFGAVGDGVADDTLPILQALERAAKIHGNLYFEDGTYRLCPQRRRTSHGSGKP